MAAEGGNQCHRTTTTVWPKPLAFGDRPVLPDLQRGSRQTIDLCQSDTESIVDVNQIA